MSLAYPWFVAQAVRALKASETCTPTTDDRQQQQQQQQQQRVSEQIAYQRSGSSSDSNDSGNRDGSTDRVAVSIVDVADALRSMEDLDRLNNERTDEGDSRHVDNDERGEKVDATDDAGANVGVSSGADGVGRARGPEEEHIRAVARTLWRRRVGVLIRTAARTSLH